MKMVWITCNESISEELMEILDSDGIAGYTVWKDVLGKDNRGSNTHWDNAVFPGKNWAFMIFCQDSNACRLREKLKDFRERPYVKKAGIKAFINDSEEII